MTQAPHPLLLQHQAAVTAQFHQRLPSFATLAVEEYSAIREHEAWQPQERQRPLHCEIAAAAAAAAADFTMTNNAQRSKHLAVLQNIL